MAKSVPVELKHHRDKRWRRSKSYAFASTRAVIPLVGAELPRAALAMPTAFLQRSGHYTLVGLMSFSPRTNLFVGPDGQWLGTYVPALIRVHPFTVVSPKGTEKYVLCVEDSSSFVPAPDEEAQDEAFFDSEGNLAPAVKKTLDFLRNLANN